jgi:uncharacterized membrane protein YbhN (UPF0104 family)
LKRLLPLLLTLIFLSLLFYFLPPKEIFSLLAEVSLKDLLLASVFYGLSHLSRSLRWRLLLKELSFFQSVGIFLWGRILDLIALFVLLTFFYALHRGDFRFYLLSLFLFFISLFIHIPVSKFKNFKGDFLTSTLASSLSVISSLLKFLSLILLLGLVPSVELFLGFLGGELSSVLPIHSFGGLGTYELSFSLPQKFLGESLKEGIKVAFIFHSFLLLSSALYGLIALYFLHKRYWGEKLPKYLTFPKKAIAYSINVKVGKQNCALVGFGGIVSPSLPKLFSQEVLSFLEFLTRDILKFIPYNDTALYSTNKKAF